MEEKELNNKCKCGNLIYNFDCMCQWIKDNSGNKHFSCQFCGIYTASKARCSECEEFD